MANRFNRRMYLVTGAARGIGRAIGQRLLEEGAIVYLGDIDPFTLGDAEAAKFGDRAIVTKLDITDLGDVMRVCRNIEQADQGINLTLPMSVACH
jgi:NAD(P)-dependent dehydrogenase (short-subunit alcohol dehydrogenase family)